MLMPILSPLSEVDLVKRECVFLPLSQPGDPILSHLVAVLIQHQLDHECAILSTQSSNLESLQSNNGTENDVDDECDEVHNSS
jgi:hypothetical protein